MQQPPYLDDLFSKLREHSVDRVISWSTRRRKMLPGKMDSISGGSNETQLFLRLDRDGVFFLGLKKDTQVI